MKRDEKSISALARDLQKDGLRMHRLVLTGYLKAMTDLGVLNEKSIPPAKVYTTSARREDNLYEALGKKVKAVADDERQRIKLAIAVLQDLFHRPVFLQEIKECGLGGGVEALHVGAEERNEVRRALLKAGVHIPSNDPAYLVSEVDIAARDALLGTLLIERFAMQHMVLEGKQQKLSAHEEGRES